MDLNFFTNPWLNVVAVLGMFIVAAVVLQVIIEFVILAFTRKTKTNVDDLLVHAMRTPLFLILLGIGIKATVNLQTVLLSNDLVNNIIDSVIYVLVIVLIIRVVNVLVDAWGRKWAEKTKSKVDDVVVHFLHKAIGITIWVVGILFVLGAWGVEIGPLLASLGIAGLAIAFALQSTLGNIFGGISMIMDKNIAIGDVIDIDGSGQQKGTVVDIGLRSTKIRTYDNEILVVPNGKLSESTLVNVAQPNPKARVVVPFGVEYGSNIEKVKKIVLKEIEKIEHLDSEMEPNVKFLEMADSSLNFKAYFYVVDFTKKFGAIDQANTLIYDALNKNKIGIPFPQMDVHMKRR